MPTKISSAQALAKQIRNDSASSKKYVIAISGFGGSGKSSTTNVLQNLLENTTVIHVDDNGAKPGFIHDWQKLENEVFKKAHSEENIISKIYDWETNKITIETTSPNKIIIIEGSAGLFLPKYIDYFDLKIWLDVPQSIANARGKKRDKEEYGVDHDQVWDNVWSPKELETFTKNRPDKNADLLLQND